MNIRFGLCVKRTILGTQRRQQGWPVSRPIFLYIHAENERGKIFMAIISTSPCDGAGEVYRAPSGIKG